MRIKINDSPQSAPRTTRRIRSIGFKEDSLDCDTVDRMTFSDSSYLSLGRLKSFGIPVFSPSIPLCLGRNLKLLDMLEAAGADSIDVLGSLSDTYGTTGIKQVEDVRTLQSQIKRWIHHPCRPNIGWRF